MGAEMPARANSVNAGSLSAALALARGGARLQGPGDKLPDAIVENRRRGWGPPGAAAAA